MPIDSIFIYQTIGFNFEANSLADNSSYLLNPSAQRLYSLTTSLFFCHHIAQYDYHIVIPKKLVAQDGAKEKASIFVPFMYTSDEPFQHHQCCCCKQILRQVQRNLKLITTIYYPAHSTYLLFVYPHYLHFSFQTSSLQIN